MRTKQDMINFYSALYTEDEALHKIVHYSKLTRRIAATLIKYSESESDLCDMISDLKNYSLDLEFWYSVLEKIRSRKNA